MLGQPVRRSPFFPLKNMSNTGWWFQTMEFYVQFHGMLFPNPDEVHHFSRWLKRTTNQVIINHH